MRRFERKSLAVSPEVSERILEEIAEIAACDCIDCEAGRLREEHQLLLRTWHDCRRRGGFWDRGRVLWTRAGAER